MELSIRLQAVADYVTAGCIAADVGCDHGYIPIYLIEQGISHHVIAMDVNQGPLERARQHIMEAGLVHAIETRLSDGLQALHKEEASVLIMAGMGGRLTIRILQNGAEVVRSAKTLVLQPQSETEQLRRYLELQGYEVVQENMVEEDGKFYPLMQVKCDRKIDKPYGQNETEYLYGKLLLQQNNKVLHQYLKQEKKLYEAIYLQLKEYEGALDTRKKLRLEEIKKRLQYIEEAFAYYV